jgi:hypothetical protein
LDFDTSFNIFLEEMMNLSDGDTSKRRNQEQNAMAAELATSKALHGRQAQKTALDAGLAKVKQR